MAEELPYASGPDSSSNKRKFEDRTTPPPSSAGTRRTTGFSAPIASKPPDTSHPPSSYSSVPHSDEIELAKQRAQEIAARLFNNVEPKRTRVENGGGGGYGSTDNTGFSSGLGQKPMFNMTPSMPTSYGYPGPSKKIEIPNGRVGVIIGKAGETIKYLQLQSGAKIQITRDMDADPNSPTRAVELVGTPEQIAKAEQLINDVLAEAESGGSGMVSRRITGQPGGAEQFVMKVPNNKVGLVIGKGGETIKNMQSRSGARIQVIPLHLPPGDTSTERTVQIDGSNEQIETAKQLVNEVISENRLGNPGMAGGYPQQGYQARPPTSWAPPAPIQQPDYGYVQPGAYPQYDMPQQPYPSSYPQQPTSGGYPTSWDSTTVPLTQQTTTQAGGYNSYYNQQAPQQLQTPPGPTDNTTPNGGYNQGSYGGYPASAPTQLGYGQQQGYNNSAPGYGNAANQTPGGQTPPPYNNTSQQSSSSPSPNPNPSYPLPQGTTQPGYGVPPTSQTVYGPGYGATQAQKPQPQPAYGQLQQSPSGQGGYGYPHSQPPTAQSGYAQAPSGYSTVSAGPGYAPVQYGVQSAPYAGSYASGYSQPSSVYSGDGNARGTYDSAPAAPQTAQPGKVAKSSPQTQS